MPNYIVTRKSDGAEVLRYAASMAQEVNGFDLVDYDHTEWTPGADPLPGVDPSRWRIYVGSFFDRFGAAKLGILSDVDPVVQAVITDASVRRYIDLMERRDELLQVIAMLNAKGYTVDPVAVLDVEPNKDEVWRG